MKPLQKECTTFKYFCPYCKTELLKLYTSVGLTTAFKCSVCNYEYTDSLDHGITIIKPTVDKET